MLIDTKLLPNFFIMVCTQGDYIVRENVNFNVYISRLNWKKPATISCVKILCSQTRKRILRWECNKCLTLYSSLQSSIDWDHQNQFSTKQLQMDQDIWNHCTRLTNNQFLHVNYKHDLFHHTNKYLMHLLTFYWICDDV